MSRVSLLLLVLACLLRRPTFTGQPARLPSAGRPGNCLQSRRSRKYQNVIIRVRYCRDLFHRLRAHPDLRQRGTLKGPIYRRAAGVDDRNAGEG